MAIARLSVKTGKKGKASPHAEYIARVGKYANYNESKDNAEKLEHTAHGNMPKWAEHDPTEFWKTADANERKNGSTYREHEIALPREMTAEQRIELVQEWVKKEIGDKPYQYAIHNPNGIDGGEQPHVHLMFNERIQDGIDRDPDQYFKRYNSKHPDRGGAKKDNTGKTHSERTQELKQLRMRWQGMCNEHLAKHGYKERIDMRSYEEQGIQKQSTNLTMSQAKSKTNLKDMYELRQAVEQYADANKLVPVAISTAKRQQKIAEQETMIRAKKQQQKRLIKEEEQRQPKPKAERPKPPEPKQTKPDLNDPDQARAMLADLDNLRQAVCQKLVDDKYKKRKDELALYAKQYNELGDKPKVFGKAKWEEQRKELQMKYREAKWAIESIDKAKEKGEYPPYIYQEVNKIMAKKNPKIDEMVLQARQTLSREASRNIQVRVKGKDRDQDRENDRGGRER